MTDDTASQGGDCALCGLPIEVEGFRLIGNQGTRRFCCEGCQGIYRILHPDEELSEPPLTDPATSR